MSRVGKCIFITIILVLPFVQHISSESIDSNDSQSKFVPVVTFYPYNGTNHHPINPDYNSVGNDLSRLSPSAGLSSDSYISRPASLSAREISNILCSEEVNSYDEYGLSDYNWIWGQFLSHDISFILTQNGRVSSAPEVMRIEIPEGDEWMDPFSIGSLVIPMDRSLYNTSTGTHEIAREFPNSITGWLDGSHVYGSSEATSNWLRSFVSGKLKTYEGFNGEFLPLAEEGDENTPPVSFSSFSPSKKYVAGDPRANEHAALTAIHVLFVREHNRLAEEIFYDNPQLSDEQIFQLARKINTAQMQYITYYEYLPSLGINLEEYQGFNSSIDPRISNSFATIAFRMGHSQITNSTLRLDEGYQTFQLGNITLSEGFWNPDRLNVEGGIAPIFRGASMTVQARNDMQYTDDLRNSMFGEPGFGGLDMCAIDIQRGRGHGLPDYNTIRESLGLETISNWSDILGDNLADVDKLNQAYPDINNADPLMGMYAEQHISGSVLGESMHALLSDQYLKLRDGDPLYFENDYELIPHMGNIMNSSLTEIILRNTEITAMQCNAMYAVDSIADLDCFQPLNEKYTTSFQGSFSPTESSYTDIEIGFTERTIESGLSSIISQDDIMWSSQGPTLSVGDCNNDGNEDLWVGPIFDHIGYETDKVESKSSTFLFTGDGQGGFTDFSIESGIKLDNSTALSATWIDYDNDGDLDLYQSNHGLVTNYSNNEAAQRDNIMFENNGNCRFKDVTHELGLKNQGYSSTSSWADYDNDGDMDLYSMNLGIVDQKNFTVYPQSNILFRNQLMEIGEPYFVDITNSVGGVHGGFIQPSNSDELQFGPGMVYRTSSVQNPSAQSSILPNIYNISTTEKLMGTGVTWAGLFTDLNSDGGDDLLVGSDFGISPIYRNMQNGQFSLSTDVSGVAVLGTAMGFDAADMDGDLDLDYCQSNFGPNFLFEQQGDLFFQEVGIRKGMFSGYASQSVTWDCNFHDIDLDGDLDLWFGSGNINPYLTFSPNTIYINDGDGNFLQYIGDESELFNPIGKTMGSVWADFDNDGDLDVIISQSNTGIHYFENDAVDNEDKNWIGLDIFQQYSNDSVNTIANGAIVDIYFSNDKSVRQVVKIGSGYAGSKDTTINLGIPQGETITKVVVKWKDGTVIEYRDLAVNQYHVLKPNDIFKQQDFVSTQDSTSLITLSVFLLIFLIAFVGFFPRHE